jgi:hypothetical protein
VEYDGGLLLVGGFCESCSDSTYLNTIYELNPAKGLNEWTLRKEHSLTSAEALAGVLVDQTQVDCQ